MDRAGRGRPVRPSALRQPFNANGDGPTAISSDDDDEAKPSARPTRRLPNKVDLSKLDMSSLLRYRKFYRLGEAPPSSTKEDLVPSVARHFAAQGVDEEEVLLRFVLAVQRVSKQVPRGQQLPITRRPMGVSKPVSQRR